MGTNYSEIGWLFPQTGLRSYKGQGSPHLSHLCRGVPGFFLRGYIYSDRQYIPCLDSDVNCQTQIISPARRHIHVYMYIYGAALVIVSELKTELRALGLGVVEINYILNMFLFKFFFFKLIVYPPCPCMGLKTNMRGVDFAFVRVEQSGKPFFKSG